LADKNLAKLIEARLNWQVYRRFTENFGTPGPHPFKTPAQATSSVSVVTTLNCTCWKFLKWHLPHSIRRSTDSGILTGAALHG